MATFSERIQAVTGFDADGSGNAFDSTTFRTLTNEWLAQGTREVISALPPPMMNFFSSSSTISSSSGLSITNGKILSVFRNDGSIEQPCRPIDAQFKGRAASSSGYFDEATSTDPVFYSENKTLFILPAPTASSGSGTGTVNLVVYPTLVYTESESDHGTFPSEVFEAVILFASIKAVEYLMQSEEDPELYQPILASAKQDYQQSLGILGGSYGGGGAVEAGE